MSKARFLTAAIILLTSMIHTLTSQVWWDELQNNYPAIIVVTAMKFSSDAAPYEIDLSIGEGALVTISARNRDTREKMTEVFSRPFSNGDAFYTADFQVELDSVYSISITLRDGTTIQVDDYSLPSGWKTHHYIHSTSGTKSHSAVLRKKKDERTGAWCFIYSLYPLRQYHAQGGTQVK
jgi:hypothetical protein